MSPAEDQKKRFSIGTWNMDHWKRSRCQRKKAWEYLQTESNTDVMLLQESVPPQDWDERQFVHREIAGHRPWGSSVVAFSEKIRVKEIDAVRTPFGPKRFSMLGTFPGSVIVTQVEVPEIGAITCVSIYGLIDVYAQTTMHRIVADLIPLFDSKFGKHVVLGGDFNITSACGTRNVPELTRYKAIFHSVESLGLVNLAETAKILPESISDCLCSRDKCIHIPTHHKAQIDWIYATPKLAHMCERLRVDDSVITDELSDHASLIAEFQISSLEYSPVCPKSFIEEMKKIAGPEDAQIAENLINWAFSKHDELRVCRYRMFYDRLPVDLLFKKSTIHFQLDDHNSKLIQWTFSITVDGYIRIYFSWMTAPYNSSVAREQLWSALNQIEGVSIEKRLNGHPKFPISALSVPDKLRQFTHMFSDMIDPTVNHNTQQSNKNE